MLRYRCALVRDKTVSQAMQSHITAIWCSQKHFLTTVKVRCLSVKIQIFFYKVK